MRVSIWAARVVVATAAAVFCLSTAAWGASSVTAVSPAPASTPPPVTPGWECVPTTAGQAVVSGGTGPAPACGSTSTAVLAPTYVSSGVGGKATAEFSGVNVQIVDGKGSTSVVNG